MGGEPTPEEPCRVGDYLLALAESERAVLVSGDQHLLVLAADFPVHTARTFLGSLDVP